MTTAHVATHGTMVPKSNEAEDASTSTTSNQFEATLTEVPQVAVRDSNPTDPVGQVQNETPAKPQATGDTSDGYHTFNELYAYRKAYNALLFNEWARHGKYGVHKSWRHGDGELCFGGGWFIVSADTPFGQVTNHYKSYDWDLFHVPEREQAASYDGHTPQQALERLLALAANWRWTVNTYPQSSDKAVTHEG